MGVKSTVTLTRAEAVTKYVELKLKSPHLLRVFRAEAELMDDKQLESYLELQNDTNAGGEGFENYLIKS